MTADDQLLCATCGHSKFLHMTNFKQECDACDDPSIPLAKRCPEFKVDTALKESVR